jgi:predicted permease
MVRSFQTVATMDTGFEASDVLTFRLALNAIDYEESEAPAGFIQRALDEIGGMPGVQSAGMSTSVPLSGSTSGRGFAIEDSPTGPDDLPPVHFFKNVSAGYFETLRIPLISGRTFERADHEEPRASVVVNEAFAQLYWPDGEAVGRRVQLGGGGEPVSAGWYTIVGVVGNVRSIRLEDEVPALAYFPLLPIVVRDEEGNRIGAGWEVRNPQFAVRTEGNPTALAGPIRQKILEMDPNLPIAGVETMEELLGRAMVQRSFTMLLLLIGSGGALLIGAVGIYGVISYVVSQQTREIGVRMTLGAEANDIAWMVLRRSLVVTAIGIVVGVLAAAFFTRFMGTMLYGVEPLDPVTFLTVIIALSAVAALAAYVPARRASRVDPLTALQYE